jgi:hypothetical protein
VAGFDFPNTPSGTLGELWGAVFRLLPQLRRRVRRGFAVDTVETPCAHGLGFAPQMAIVSPQGDVTVWETRAPDTKFVYLAASKAALVNVEFVP